MVGQRIGVALLGPVSITSAGAEVVLGSGPQARLLARLVIGRGLAVSRDRLLDAVWPDGDGTTGKLRVSIHRLRERLTQPGRPDVPLVIERLGDGWALHEVMLELDIEVLERCVRESASEQDRRAALAWVDRGLRCWRGDPFASLDVDWLIAERERLIDLRETLIDRRVELLLDQIEPDAAVAEIRSAVRAAPDRERRVAALMLALYRDGRHVEALSAYRTHEEAMAERGLVPSARLQRLEGQVLRHDPALTAAPSVQPRPVTPTATLMEAASALASIGADVVGSAVLAAATTAAAALDRRSQGRVWLTEAQAASSLGDLVRVDQLLRAASSTARENRDLDLLFDIAIARFGAGVGGGNDTLADVLEPLALLPPRDPRRSTLLTAAAFVITMDGGASLAAPVLAEAEALSRLHSSDEAQATAALARTILGFARGAPLSSVHEWLVTAAAGATQAGDYDLMLATRHLDVRLQLLRGATRSVADGIETLEREGRASKLRFGRVRPSRLSAALALFEGRLDDAAEHIARTTAIGARLGVQSTEPASAAQTLLLLLEQAKFETVLRAAAAVEGHPDFATATALAVTHAHLGDLAATHRYLDGITDIDRFDDTMNDGLLGPLSEAAWLSGHRPMARQIRARLSNAENTLLVVGLGTLILGPTAHALALAEATLGNRARAATLLRTAAATAELAGSPLWAARCRLNLVAVQAAERRGTDSDLAAAGPDPNLTPLLAHRYRQVRVALM